MSDENPKTNVNLGMFSRPRKADVMPGDIIAAALSVVWILFCVAFFLFARRPDSTVTFDRLNFVVTLLAVLLPIALIWVAAVAARSVSVVREESMRLQAAMDVLRQNYVELSQSKRLQITPATFTHTPPPGPNPTAPAAPKPTEEPTPEHKAPAPQFSSQRQQIRTPNAQPDLALGIPDAATLPQLGAEDFIRALNFPKTADDKAGFRSLRLALADPRVGKLVQASQDILTLLSQDGVYMDDLTPERTRPDIWRKFADGQRGPAIATIGGIRDRASLSAAALRMRQDHIFRDAAHHFLRQFDHIFTAFAPDATDAEIAALTDTRTARAFMLLGRVAGTFD